MKRYWCLAAFGCACLSLAAVWFGGLNQDEGWYLYAANLVRAGSRVYRDFAFTQGPVMPHVYAPFAWFWTQGGLLGARVFTLSIGLMGIVFAALTARKLAMRAPAGTAAANAAALIVAMLLGCNLYHLYYLAIPKTYALASLFVMAGLWCLVSARLAFAGGVLLGLAAGVRISLGAILPVAGCGLVVAGCGLRGRAGLWRVVGFGAGGMIGLAVAYGGVLFDAGTMKGFLAAQAYHAARGGFDLTWVVGSLSRLVRWYLPVFIVLGLGGFTRARLWLAAFLAVFAVQMLAPFPYEDYQVPVMGLLAVYAAVNFVDEKASTPNPQLTTPNPQPPTPNSQPTTPNSQPTTHNSQLSLPQPTTRKVLLVLGLTFANSFGSPLLEKWMTNGQDRFWSLKKEQCELAQLRDAARRIEAIDPNGKEIFTQDLYLAIETNRTVPKGLEMGPFSILTDAEWRQMLSSVTCPVAAISGYTFAIEPPACNERAVEQQLEYLNLLKRNYEPVDRLADFGQNATTLILLKRK